MGNQQIVDYLVQQHHFKIKLNSSKWIVFEKENKEIDFYKNIHYLTFKSILRKINSLKEIDEFVRKINEDL